MVKIRSKKALWEDTKEVKILYWEECPNPKCPTMELHYPDDMLNPHCPDCKTLLPGQNNELRKGVNQRIAWHREEQA